MSSARSSIWSWLVWGVLLPCSLFFCAVSPPENDNHPDKEDVNFKSEIERLEKELSNCASGDTGRSCRSVIQFKIAYLSERHSTRDQAARRQLLAQSASFYNRVLDENPGHGPTQTNLALVYASLGDVQGLGDIVRSKASSGANREAARLAILIGDVEAKSKGFEQAFQAYKWASELNPGSDVPRRKMVEAYAQISDGSITRLLLDELPNWELRFPEVTLFAYRTILERQKEIDPGISEIALLGWVELASRQRRISPALIDETFGDLNINPLRDLSALLKDPTIGTDPPRDDRLFRFLNIMEFKGNVGWWTDTPARRHALAATALAVGHAAIVDGQPVLAERRWIGGLHLAPPMPLYRNELKDRSPVPLDILTELLSLQFRYPDLDPSGRKFQLYIELIFRSKGQAYRVNDLRAIQRHHTVLGTIFAEKGIWRGDYAANAEFQLTHAVEAAEKREYLTGFHQPLPELKKLLAQGYRNANNSEKARHWYLEAAEGYLDTDQYSQTHAMLESASKLSLSGSRLSRYRAMRAVLTTRQKIDEALKKSMAGAQAVTIDLTREDRSWLFEDPAGLSNQFAARQRFKTLADLASLQLKTSNLLQAQAFADKALNASQNISTLSGTGDLIRLEQALASSSKWSDQTVDLHYGMDLSKTHMAWRIDLPSVEAPVFAVLDKPFILPKPPVPVDLHKRSLYFDFDSSRINSAHRETLNRWVVSALKAHPHIKLHISGYSDNIGTAEYNLGLSQLRAQAVFDYLVSQGISSGRLSVGARGEENPIATNNTASGRAKNRRVEFVVE